VKFTEHLKAVGSTLGGRPAFLKFCFIKTGLSGFGKMYVCTAGSQWRLRLWSNRWLHAHGKGYLLQILFHAADNIPCHVHVNIQTDNQKIEKSD